MIYERERRDITPTGPRRVCSNPSEAGRDTCAGRSRFFWRAVGEVCSCPSLGISWNLRLRAFGFEGEISQCLTSSKVLTASLSPGGSILGGSSSAAFMPNTIVTSLQQPQGSQADLGPQKSLRMTFWDSGPVGSTWTLPSETDSFVFYEREDKEGMARGWRQSCFR